VRFGNLLAMQVDARSSRRNVRFSNRPFGVKHFQTVRRCSVDVTHGLDLKVTVQKMIVAGDYVTVHMSFTGHFTGSFGQTQGNGRPVPFIPIL
jgi:hypothetical protein